ncbi:GMP synthase [Flavimobilis marinus]|uniref:GMP synthase (Glutamine-hydrolysing) n=1 Tax=Flavimobilis marinus TaxID=285351 RepID=A0A1I2FQB9_9MICO|nr:gamma-glutamyl-gamma-aminobutyrate hydrolase family protein [Flavimobilis marinus]GHG51639.1 GMP synthase [Flavimobilis marinus]SFF06631.1 GMP synthase (glutamine-hydrolysing) [Flavimobilis marinus]
MSSLTAAPVLVLQHAEFEQPGVIARALELAGVPWESRIILDDVDPELPDVRELSGLVVLGGAPGALDDAAHPGLAAERRLLAAAVDADLPTLGVCLGMQLLAVALGAQSLPQHGQEIGFAPLKVHGDGIRDRLLYPLVVDAGADPDVLHWHDDAVDAPAGATVLASTDATPVQAFRLGSAVGLQFHLELDPPLLAAWLAHPEGGGSLPPQTVRAIASDGARLLPSLAPRAQMAFGTFAADARDRRG